MNFRLISLTFAPFAFGTSAFVLIGLIGPIATDLEVSVPVVGQLQLVFALACGLGGPILARLLGNIDRKNLLIAVLLSLVLMNALSALASHFETIASIRFIGGLFAALTLPLATTIAVNMVEESERPKAIATVLAGYTLAFLIGIPLGSILGDAYGWRAAFWFATAIALLGAVVVAFVAPSNIAIPSTVGVGFKRALTDENIKLIFITMLSFLATFTTVAYIGPVITATSGIKGSGIGAVQIATGIGSLLGLPAGAAFARLHIRKALTILLLLIALTQGMFSIGMLFQLDWLAVPILIIAMALGSAALFASLPVIQSKLVGAAGAAATIALAMNGSMLYFGQGLGAAAGGVIIASFGISWIGIGGIISTLLALMLVYGLSSSRNSET